MHLYRSGTSSAELLRDRESAHADLRAETPPESALGMAIGVRRDWVAVKEAADGGAEVLLLSR
jgi:hypothetical protein